MGLVGFCLAPMMGQVTVDYHRHHRLCPPARRLWLKLMSENRSTIAYSPSFGYELAARRINGEAPTLDLSQLAGGRHWRRHGARRCARRFSPTRFRWRASDHMPSCRAMAWRNRRLPFPSPMSTQPIRIDTLIRSHVQAVSAAPCRQAHRPGRKDASAQFRRLRRAAAGP